MISVKVVAFVPLKLNNERLPGKNLKPFDNGRPLLSYILDTAVRVNELDEIYCYCSDSSVIEYLPGGVIFLERSTKLDQSTTSITEVISNFTAEVEADIYVLIHATAPFISVENIEEGVHAIKKREHDSALSVKKNQEFLWLGNKPMNYDLYNIPRIQDLDPFYIETTGMYIFTKNLAKQDRRIGDRPFLVEVSDIEAIDINNPSDFEIANAVFNHIVLKK